jgi:hypothetical protein
VIRAEVANDHLVLVSDRDDVVAYVDAEWIPSRTGPVPALVIEGTHIRWSSEAGGVALPHGLDSEHGAQLVLVDVALDAVEAVADVPAGLVKVIGEGLVASRVRQLLGTRFDPHDAAPPAAVIDTTGVPEVFVAAIRDLADRGMLVLAGQPHRVVDLDLYPDVHVRGLELVGIAPPLSRGAPWDHGRGRHSTAATVIEPARRVAIGAALPRGGSWYCVTARGNAGS